jgi:hypothetical protein
MIGRRKFLQLGPATLTSALVLDWDRAVAATGFNHADVLGRGIFDARFAESRNFGDTLAAHGVQTTPIQDDVASLWYDDLRSQLRKVPTPIAGLTDRSALFCLEELARDVGMRVITRIDHLMDRSGIVRHDAIGPASIVETMQPLHDRESYGHLTALLVMQHESQRAPRPEAQKRTGPGQPAGATALVTWVIA